MITLGMNSWEIQEAMNKDMTRMQGWLQYKLEEFRRLQKKNPPKLRYAKLFKKTIKESRQEYWIFCMNCPELKFPGTAILAVVRDNNRTYYVRTKADNDTQIVMFSSHLFGRFAERGPIPGLIGKPTEEIMKHWIIRNGVEQNVYRNDVSLSEGTDVSEHCTRMVYAVQDGLVLAQVEPGTHHCIYRTYVSTEMLGDTQREAFEVVYPLVVPENLGILEREDLKDFEEKRSGWTRPFSMVAQGVYEQFWAE